MGKGITIVSGGQTGVDRAALEWALKRRVLCCGWCPKGRRAEDGVIAGRFPMQEAASAEYGQRTEWNVRDSDATVVFASWRRLGRGTMLALEVAQRLGRPTLVLVAEVVSIGEAATVLRGFLWGHGVGVLNVAGPRASEQAHAGWFAASVLDLTFGFTP